MQTIGVDGAEHDLVAQHELAVEAPDIELDVLAGTHDHSWKRTDDGSETVLFHGPCIVQRTTQV